MGRHSTPLRAAIVNDFIYRYNKKWGEDWTVGISTEYDRVDIYSRRPECTTADGHFIANLNAFCEEHFNSTPCVGWLFGRLNFWI